MIFLDAKDFFLWLLKAIGILIIVAALAFLAIFLGIAVTNFTDHETEFFVLTEEDYEASKDEWFNTFDNGKPVKDSIRDKQQENLIANQTYYCVLSYSGILGAMFESPAPSGFIGFTDAPDLEILSVDSCLHEIKHNSWERFFNITRGDVDEITVNADFDNENKCARFNIETGVTTMRMRFAVKFVPLTDGTVAVNSQIDFTSPSQTYSTGAITLDGSVTYDKSVRITDISTRFVAAKDCENGEINDNLLFDNAFFDKGETYYAVTDFTLRPMRDNDGSGVVNCVFEVLSGAIDCTLFEAASGDFTQKSDENGTKITLSVSLPPLVNDVKNMRVIIKFTPKSECNAEYSVSFYGDEITCSYENNAVILYCFRFPFGI